MARPPLKRLALVFGLGVLAAAGQAPLDAWVLALPAYAGIIAAVMRAPDARAGFWLAWMAGAGHFMAALSWIVEPFLIDLARHGWMAPFALVLMGFGLALFWAAAGWITVRVAQGPARALAFVVALTFAEMLRGHALTGFPWALPGHILIETPLVQGAAVLGAYGLTLLVLGLAALPVALGRRGAGLALILIAAGWGGGLMRLSQPLPEATGAVLRLVQPNAEQTAKWDPEQAQRLMELQLAFTAAVPADGRRPDLVIWPETALPYLLGPGDAATRAIWEAGGGVPVAVGAQRMAGERAFNSLAVIGAGGQLTGLYDKHHLVPFGEYIPFGDSAYAWLGLRAFAAQTGYGYAAGPEARLLDLGPKLGQALPLICYEAVFAQDLRAAPGRARWILQITNDAWFGTLTGPFQHAAQARLRAVEQGLPLVRVANTGMTFATDAYGRITEGLDFGVAAYADVALPGALPPTPYARFGEIPLLVLLAGLGGWVILTRRRAGA